MGGRRVYIIGMVVQSNEPSVNFPFMCCDQVQTCCFIEPGGPQPSGAHAIVCGTVVDQPYLGVKAEIITNIAETDIDLNLFKEAITLEHNNNMKDLFFPEGTPN